MKTSFAKVIGLPFVLLATLALAPISSAWAKNSTSLGKGVKCTFVSTPQPNGSVVHVQVCRKSGV
jgi:hypothetical protein